FIVTLGTFFVLQGVNAAGTLKITGTVAIENIDTTPGFNSAYRWFSSTLWSPYDFKVKVLWWIGITALGAWLLARTRFGNWIYAVGGDPTAARYVGVPVARTKIILFVITSTTAALLGVIEALELRSTQANEVVGTSFGAAILGMASIGIILAGWDSNWTYTFLGAILLAAVLMNAAFRARA